MISIVLFHNTTSIFAKIISWFEGSTISHAGIGLEIDGVPFILHAAWAGVQLIPRANVLENHTVVAEFETIPNISGEVNLAESKIGEAYSVLTLFGYLFVLLGRKLHIGINNPLSCKSGTVCSQFVVEVDINHEIPEFDGLDPANIMPLDLYNICCAGKSFRRIS